MRGPASGRGACFIDTGPVFPPTRSLRPAWGPASGVDPCYPAPTRPRSTRPSARSSPSANPRRGRGSKGTRMVPHTPAWFPTHPHGSPQMSHAIPLPVIQTLKSDRCNSNVFRARRKLTQGNCMRLFGEERLPLADEAELPPVSWTSKLKSKLQGAVHVDAVAAIPHIRYWRHSLLTTVPPCHCPARRSLRARSRCNARLSDGLSSAARPAFQAVVMKRCTCSS